MNIIPDRNWNFADPAVKEKKTAALAAFVAEARKRDLPIIAGTELNGPGQKFVDSFDAPELAPYVADFMNGAYWLYGHTVLDRFGDKGVFSPWAGRVFKDDRAASFAFYADAGREILPGKELLGSVLAGATRSNTIIRLLKDSQG